MFTFMLNSFTDLLFKILIYNQIKNPTQKET